jgi:hypothetical protein
MRSTITKIFGGVLAVGLVTAYSPEPADAALSDCAEGNICLFDSINYGTLIYAITPGAILAQPTDCVVLPSSANNRASSIYVRAGLMSRSMTLFDGAGGGASRGISGASTPYQDANMLTSPGIASFSNVVTSICVNP